MRLEEEEDRVEGVGLSSRCWRRRETSGMAPSVTAYAEDNVKQESNEQSHEQFQMITHPVQWIHPNRISGRQMKINEQRCAIERYRLQYHKLQKPCIIPCAKGQSTPQTKIRQDLTICGQ